MNNTVYCNSFTQSHLLEQLEKEVTWHLCFPTKPGEVGLEQIRQNHV